MNGIASALWFTVESLTGVGEISLLARKFGEPSNFCSFFLFWKVAFLQNLTCLWVFLFIKDFYLKQLFYYLPIKFFGDNIK